MPLLLSPEQELVKKVVAEFAQQDLAPDATRVDREARFPRHHVEKMAPLGLLGMLVPAQHGGAGTDTLSFIVAIEEVAKVSGTDAAFMILQNCLVSQLLVALGSQAQREQYLAPLLKGQRLGACAIAEEAAGSRTDLIRARARPQEDHLVIKGSKMLVSMVGEADFFLVLTQSSEGPQFAIVPRDAKGLHFSPAESKLGLRGLPVADMYLNQVEIPAENVLGEPGSATEAMQEPLDLARLASSAALVGLTQGALSMSIDFARSRIQFGQPIARFGAIRGMIADVQAELEAARATTYGAASLRDGRKAYREEVYEARLLSHRIAVKGTKIAHKIHGGAGFMRDLPLERISRDVRTLMHFWDAQDIARARLADILLGD